VKRKIVEKPPLNSAGFCGGGQGLNWAMEPRKEEEEENKFLRTSVGRNRLKKILPGDGIYLPPRRRKKMQSFDWKISEYQGLKKSATVKGM
jgi:hypothetical protein